MEHAMMILPTRALFCTAVTLASVGVVATPSSSRAMDCAKARTPVEVAICANEKLKADDARLSSRYFAALQAAKANGGTGDGKSRHDALIARQREWLAQREKTCGGMARDRIEACIADSMRERTSELSRQEIDQEEDVPAEGLMLGAEKLTLAATSDGTKALQHKGRTVIEAPASDDHPFTVLRHWNSAETQAILINAGSAASNECATTYVVETRKPGEVVAHELGTTCVAFDATDVKRDQRGFSLTQPATPMEDGETTTWIAKSGELAKTRVRFEPVSGTTMADLVRHEKPETEAPLANAEFYAAVNRLPTPDRTHVMAALWQVENGCESCRGPAAQRFYGVRIDSDAVAYSGCGLTMSGADVSCGEDDALAVWDRRTGAFYFAVAPHRPDGRHAGDVGPHGAAHFYPSLNEWSPAARAKFAAWNAGEKWTVKND